MAKRIYTPRVLSPEVARQNALSEAKSLVMNATANLQLAERDLAVALQRAGKPGYGEREIADRQQEAEYARKNLAACEARLAATLAEHGA